MTLPSFPCDGSPGLIGGYRTLDLEVAQNDEDLYYIVNEVFNYFYSATVNLTDCTFIEVDYSNLTNACSQVVSGTNYAVEFTVVYDCIEEDVGFGSLTLAPLRSTVYVPLADASLNTEDKAINGPVIKDIWFYQPPEVIATSEATPEESSPEEGSPEEAPAPEEATPEEAPATNSSPGTTTDFLTPSGGSTGISSSVSQLQFQSSPVSSPFASSAASSSSPGMSPEPEPQIEIGFDLAAQNKSIIAG
ncbi:hypothetical protein WJX77_010080 [Trebouxia sp. C0004]